MSSLGAACLVLLVLVAPPEGLVVEVTVLFTFLGPALTLRVVAAAALGGIVLSQGAAALGSAANEKSDKIFRCHEYFM